MKNLYTRFKVPIYDWKAVVVMTQDMSAWAMKHPDQEASHADQCLALFIPDDEKKRITIVLRPESPVHHIAHEIGHAARHIMGYIGFQIVPSNDEPLAYLEDFLHRKVSAIKWGKI